MNALFRLLGLGLLAYVGFALLVMLFQRSLMYQPSRVSTAELDGHAAERQMRPWTNVAGARIGWRRDSRLGPAQGGVLILHGNAGTAVGREYLADPLQEALPLDVFILEYPGYADRPGKPSQASILAAAGEAAELLLDQPKLFLVGESLGTGPAAYLAGRLGERVAGLVFLVPYNRLDSVAAVHYPWLPVRWLVWDRFPAEEWLRSYRGPAAFVIAGADRVIPSALGRALYDGFGGSKRITEIAGADHEDVLRQPAEWWRSVGTFWGLPADRNAPGFAPKIH